MEKLIEILTDLHPDVDFATEEGLVDNGILDSLDIVTLITEINDKFDVSIPAEEIIPENFNSAAALMALIERLDEE
ncbi:MAG: acyl carrier protein [Clostridia bacterium]|jgi:acyl carrier protein|nr:acyl carrier protein [Oscillospiraceae bacterium]MBQ3012602.1 acyl carrier protein [Clostridia bacterium]MBQ7829515.1 acyl carrier protein [Clostridia bacterium]